MMLHEEEAGRHGLGSVEQNPSLRIGLGLGWVVR